MNTRHFLHAGLACIALFFTPLGPLSAEVAVDETTIGSTVCQGLRRSDFAYVKKDEGRAVQRALHALYKDDPRYQEESGTRGQPLSDGIIGPVTVSWLKYFCESRALAGENLAPLVIQTLLAPPPVAELPPTPPPVVPQPPAPAPKNIWSYFMISDADLKTLAAPGVLSAELLQWNAALADIVDVRYPDRKTLKNDMDGALKASGPQLDAYKEKLLAAVQTVKTVQLSERSLLRLQGRIPETDLEVLRSEMPEVEYPTAQALAQAAKDLGIPDQAVLKEIVAKAEPGSYIVLAASALQKPVAAVRPIPKELLTLLTPMAQKQYASHMLLESAIRMQIASGTLTYGEAMLRCPYEFEDCQSKRRTDSFKAVDALFLALRKNIPELVELSSTVGNVELPLTSSEMNNLFGDPNFNVGGHVPTREDVYAMWQEQKADVKSETQAAHGAWLRVARDEAAVVRAVRFKQFLRAQMLYHRYAPDIDAQIDTEKTDTQDQVNALWTGDGCGCVQDGLAGIVYGFYPYGKGALPPAPETEEAKTAAPAAKKLDFSVLSSIGLYGLTFDNDGRLLEHSSGRYVDEQFVNAETVAFVREAGKWDTRIDWVVHKRWDGAPADKSVLFRQLVGELETFITRPLPGFSTRFWAAVAAPFPMPNKNKLLTVGDGITLHFEDYPQDELSVKQFNDFVALLQQRLGSAGRRYAVNIVVPAHQLGSGIYTLKNLSSFITGRHAGYENAAEARRIAPDMYILVLIPEPVDELKLSLRAAIEAGLMGEERVFMLRHTVPVIGSGLGDQDTLKDQIIYARDNFGGVGLWPIPLDQSEAFDQQIARTIEASFIEDAGRVIGDQTLGWLAPVAADSVQAWVCQWRNWIRLLFITSLLTGIGCYAGMRLSCQCDDELSFSEIGSFVGLAVAVFSFSTLLFFDPDMVEMSQSRLFWMGAIAVTAFGVGLPYILKLKKSQNPSRNDYRSLRARSAVVPMRSMPAPRALPAGDLAAPAPNEVSATQSSSVLSSQWHAQLREALIPLWEYLNEAPRSNEDLDFTRQRLRELATPLESFLGSDQPVSTRAYEEAAAAVGRIRNYLERDKEADPVTRARVRALIKAVRLNLGSTEKEKEHAKMRQTLAALGGRLEQDARDLACARKKIDGLMGPLWAHVDAIDEQARHEAETKQILELGERLLERKQVNER